MLAGVESDGGISAVPPSDIHAARHEIARIRGNLDRFDISVICPDVPSADDLHAYTSADVTWIVVTGWVQHLADVIAAGPPQ